MLFKFNISSYLYFILLQLAILYKVFHVVYTFHTAIGSISTLQPSPVVEALLLAGIIPTVVLLLANVVTALLVFLVTRHCYKKTSQKSSPSKGEDVYDQVEGPKTYEDIVMTDSPAYGPVKWDKTWCVWCE